MKRYFIYTLSVGDRVFYIGVTTGPKTRLAYHKVRFGKGISMDIVDEYFGSQEAACALETFWIKKYRDLGIELENVKGNSEDRKSRSYKARDDVYNAAMAVAEANGTTLSEVVERFVAMYAEGLPLDVIYASFGLKYSK